MNGQARQVQIHGGDIYRNRNATDYSVNSNPLGPPDAVLEALHELSLIHIFPLSAAPIT